MTFDFLLPVSETVLSENENIGGQALGNKIRIHTKADGIPDLEQVKMAIIGIRENRNAVNYDESEIHFDAIRKALYGLFPGNWFTNIADLGDILQGESVSDTYFAMQSLVTELLRKNIIPLILGGSQDLIYANYRAYDEIRPMVNIVNVDSNFDLGDSSLPITNNSYLGKIILEEPYNLFNYATLGYQTYFNSQEEIDLMEKLHFEAYRLGSVSNAITLAEPVMRDADIVSIDLKSVKASEVSEGQYYSPNGLDGKEVCAMARYAGISNKVSSFGIYEYQPSKSSALTATLVAQMLWYFIEGVNCRIKDDDFKNEDSYQKFNVLVEDDNLIFFKSIKTGRWWIEIPFLPNVNNKLKRHTLLPCMYEEYVEATHGKIPERWYKAYSKNSF